MIYKEIYVKAGIFTVLSQTRPIPIFRKLIRRYSVNSQKNIIVDK